MKALEIEGLFYVAAAEVASLAAMKSKAFTIDLGDQGVCEGFLLREHDRTLRAYKNSCPHTGAPLNWTPDQFLTTNGRYIQCSIHGAMFVTETGECFAGPCAGKFLTPFQVLEKEGMSYIAVTEIQKSPSK